MSDTPRTDAQSSFDEFYVESCDASFARKIERELNAANTQIGLLIAGSKQQERQIEFLQGRVKELEEAISFVVPVCNSLHHPLKHRHKSNETCPVESLIRKAKGTK